MIVKFFNPKLPEIVLVPKGKTTVEVAGSSITPGEGA
jgi:hypothetical protein